MNDMQRFGELGLSNGGPDNGDGRKHLVEKKTFHLNLKPKWNNSKGARLKHEMDIYNFWANKEDLEKK